MIGILSEYYPETLAMSYMLEVPFVIRTLMNIMWPFIDPNTKKKIKIVYGPPKSVVEDGSLNPEGLLKECGGDVDVGPSTLSGEEVSAADEVVALRSYDLLARLNGAM